MRVKLCPSGGVVAELDAVVALSWHRKHVLRTERFLIGIWGSLPSALVSWDSLYATGSLIGRIQAVLNTSMLSVPMAMFTGF